MIKYLEPVLILALTIGLAYMFSPKETQLQKCVKYYQQEMKNSNLTLKELKNYKELSVEYCQIMINHGMKF